MNQFAALICLGFLACNAPLQAAAAADADSILRKVGSFAVGGVGEGGEMSEGERALREVLKQSDAVARLESVLPGASPPGQLYALLGLRVSNRDAYKRALDAYGQRNIIVEAIHGCMIMDRPFRDLVKEMDRGEYDSSLSRTWPGRGH